jgi:hypothetical protein
MWITVKTNFPQVQAALSRAAGQVPYALKTAINRTAEWAQTDVRREMRRVFDRPTPWVLNSLRIKYASKTKLQAELAFKDVSLGETSASMLEPHIFGGKRRFKGMEGRLRAIGVLPDGWYAVPGGGAKLDAYGNMSRGQISQMLNVLGAFTEAGYNKANAATRERLAKGNAKKGTYGLVYWVNPVAGATKGKHLPPGVYQRIKTAFGSSLKPILIFVKGTSYKQRLAFFDVVQKTVDTRFPGEFDTAFTKAMATAFQVGTA